ncbi:MAG: hypothetical protein CSB23_00250 [Deltaproteobacteria bacterium]|nr:MAG: hypothetical protein CSB23_00250 [Deltaproteobacteria bacterium]
MPNTLCHIGIQAPINGIILKKQDLFWVIVACILPDLPWIELKILLFSHSVNPYDTRLYCTVQASLLFCLILSACIALGCAHSAKIFLILSINCLLHLLLDALQIKWGNGVHIIAPIDWKFCSFKLFWPEHPGTVLLTVGGAVYLLRYWRMIADQGIVLSQNAVKRAAVLLFALVYLLAPLIFMPDLEAADVYYIATLRNKTERPGKTIQLDRVRYSSERQQVKIYSGESFRLTGKRPQRSGRVSIAGVFTDSGTIACTSWRRSGNYRDYASIVGLLMACVLLLQIVLSKKKRPYKQT